MLQFRATLDLAGRIAGLAGELDASESEVCRRLVERALEAGGRTLLEELRSEILAERQAEPTEAELQAQIEAHEARNA